MSRQGTYASPLPIDAVGTWAGKDAGSPSRSPPDEMACHHCTPGPISSWAIQQPIAAQDGTSRSNDYRGPSTRRLISLAGTPRFFRLVFLLFSVCFPEVGQFSCLFGRAVVAGDYFYASPFPSLPSCPTMDGDDHDGEQHPRQFLLAPDQPAPVGNLDAEGVLTQPAETEDHTLVETSFNSLDDARPETPLKTEKETIPITEATRIRHGRKSSPTSPSKSVLTVA